MTEGTCPECRLEVPTKRGRLVEHIRPDSPPLPSGRGSTEYTCAGSGEFSVEHKRGGVAAPVTREIPRPAVGWRVGRRVFATPGQAYYEIAKRLVVAKYPALLNRQDGDYVLREQGWTDDAIARRAAKAHALFYRRVDSEISDYEDFDQKAWIAFVRRVARYLRFVDKRRGLRGLHTGHFPAEERALLDAEHETAERDGCALLDYAAAVKREIDRRGEAEDRARAGAAEGP